MGKREIGREWCDEDEKRQAGRWTTGGTVEN